jgi:hypothetical protein
MDFDASKEGATKITLITLEESATVRSWDAPAFLGISAEFLAF